MTATLTAAQAQTFTRHSVTNALALTNAAKARGCTCRPYVDWYTYRRWKAQGQQVMKGSKGVKLSTYVQTTTDNKDGTTTTRRRPWFYFAFCRCQVTAVGQPKPKGEKAP